MSVVRRPSERVTGIEPAVSAWEDERILMALNGAFRHEVTTMNGLLTYGICETCMRLYEYEGRAMGFPNLSNGEAIRRAAEADRERARLKRERTLLFADPANRCICDPESDAEYLFRAVEFEKAKQNSAARTQESKSSSNASSIPPVDKLWWSADEIGVTTPEQAAGNLGTTQAALGGPPIASNSGTSNSDLTEQLRQLVDLFNSGALTKEQFEAAKNKLLGM